MSADKDTSGIKNHHWRLSDPRQRDRRQQVAKRYCYAKHCADQNVAAHERIAVAAREQTAPRDDPLRPALAHKRFQGDVEQPQETHGEPALGEVDQKEIKLVFEPAVVVFAEQPIQHAGR